MSYTILMTGLVIGSFLLGSIPIGMIVARQFGIDIFAAGSGNPGATNVWRAVSPNAGRLVFLLDVAKGLIPAFAARYIDPEQAVWFGVGLVAVLGHSFSPFTSFRGGKGVSAALGAALGSAPLVAVSALALFIITLALFRFVSLASSIAAISTIPLSLLIPGQSRYLPLLFGFLALLVLVRHRANYRRLLNGEEPKFKLRQDAAESGKDD